ncbi:SH3 domain-containing protein [Bacillus cereus]|uniref:SH3 domain-containing protein n=1 Tax=Bacillus cereus TaxID=1396 RepID=UPI0018F5AA6C|nr:SH3 domain-containing protein [Bacillus cereus]MBJ8095579.1 SH3 domain-containing protein [Bacillus cereus]
MKMITTTFSLTTAAIATLLPSVVAADSHAVSIPQNDKVKIEFVNFDKVHLYQDATTNSNSIGNITFNTPVKIIETTPDWYKVDVQNKIGYMQKSYLSPTKQTQPKNQYIVNAIALNVRIEPNAESTILGVLPNGKYISILEECGEWYKISYNGKTGYVKKEFVSDGSYSMVKGTTVQGNSSYYVATPVLRVRSGAGTNTSIIGSLKNGTQLQVVETVGSWYKIRFGSGFGYVAKHYVLQNKPQETPSIPAVFKYPTKGIVSSTFDVRWGEMHYGVDFTAPGEVPILAATSGKVIKSYYSNSYGNVVFIAHTIDGKLYTTVYAHLKDRTVQAGDRVETGQMIGHMGNTGHSTGQHLHFELHNGEWNFEKTNAVNPIPYLVQ